MTTYPHVSVDVKGRQIAVGDWVRVVALPDVSRLPRDAQRAFRFAMNKTFRIDAFDRYGHAELDLTQKMRAFHTIWLEPNFLSRSRALRHRET